MKTFTYDAEAESKPPNSELVWNSLYAFLLSVVLHWTYAADINSWIGQEKDIAWDIVLVTINRTYEYMLNARLNGIEVVSLKSLSITIARNYFQDRRRKDQRLQRLEYYLETEHGFADEATDFVEVVHEQIYRRWLFNRMAQIVDDFAPKTRLALLMHMADKLEKDGAFDGEPTQLELAFIDHGMYLREYRYSLQHASDRERASISSLASYGYKRLAEKLREMLESAQKRDRRGRKETDDVH